MGDNKILKFILTPRPPDNIMTIGTETSKGFLLLIVKSLLRNKIYQGLHAKRQRRKLPDLVSMGNIDYFSVLFTTLTHPTPVTNSMP